MAAAGRLVPYLREEDPRYTKVAVTELEAAESLDSRNRDSPTTTTPSEYTIQLGSRHEGVHRLTLADFCLGSPDPRLTFEETYRRFRFSFGVNLPAVSAFAYTPSGGSATTVYLPPTVIPTSSPSGSTDVSFTLANAATVLSVRQGFLLWPTTLTETKPRIVATESVAYDATFSDVFTSGTTVTLRTGVDYSALGIASTKYVDGAYIHFPRLSVIELASVVNSLFSTNSIPITCTWNDTAGSVTLSCTTASTLTVTANDALWMLGFNAGTITFSSSRTSYTAIPRVIRTAVLPLGRFDDSTLRDTLIANLERSCAPQWTPNLSSPPQLVGNDSDGTAFTIDFPLGNPGPEELASFLDTALDTYDITFSYNETYGRFTISHDNGYPFRINFASSAQTQEAANILGFSPLGIYEGRSTYTGANDAASARSTLDDTQPRLPLRWAYDTSLGRLFVDYASNPHGQAAYYFKQNGSSNLFDFYSTSSSSSDQVSPGLVPGDVIRATVTLSSLGSRVVTGVVTDVWTASGVATQQAKIDFEDEVIANITSAMCTGVVGSRNVALIHGDDPIYLNNPRPPAEDPILYNLSSSEYGSAAEQLGLARTAASLPLTLPYTPHLAPPDYVLVEILEPTTHDVLHTHVGVDERRTTQSSHERRHILAKLIITNGYARISEDLNTMSLVGPVTLDSIRLRFLNPDLSLVDWHGHDHSFTIVFRKYAGHARQVLM